MKTTIALLIMTAGLTTANAAVLAPISSSTRECTAKATDVTYQVQATCWKNLDGQFRLWFPATDNLNLKDTGVNTKYINNVDAACATTTLYAYEDLFGANARPPEQIVTQQVEIAYTQLDASACYQR